MLRTDPGAPPRRRFAALFALIGLPGCALPGTVTRAEIDAAVHASLQPLGVARAASDYLCEQGRWPGSIAELRAWSGEEAIPAPTWERLASVASLRQEGDALLLFAEPVAPIAELRERRVHFTLTVERPACWPPLGVRADPDAGLP